MNRILADTGPLVALLDRREAHHEWAKSCFSRWKDPILTCEAVLAEAMFLLLRGGIEPEFVLQLVTRGVIRVDYKVQDEAEALTKLMQRYRNIPMTLADACLVRMSEVYEDSSVFTLNSDFIIYRKFHRRIIPVIMPE